jgi:hypothetical protein
MVRKTAIERLLAKLPATAATLTPPERGMLRMCEKYGLIRYIEQSGTWVKDPVVPADGYECTTFTLD